MRFEGKGPTGGGVNEVMVGDDGRMLTEAVAIQWEGKEAIDGKAYLLHSHFLALTSVAADQAMMMITNNSNTEHMHVGNVRTCASSLTVPNFAKYILYQNPTSMSGSPVTGTVVNANSGKQVSSDVSYLIGGQGFTFSGGTAMGTWVDDVPGHSIQNYRGGLILAPGHSIGISVQAGDITTAFEACTTWFVWMEAPHS